MTLFVQGGVIILQGNGLGKELLRNTGHWKQRLIQGWADLLVGWLVALVSLDRDHFVITLCSRGWAAAFSDLIWRFSSLTFSL